MKRQPEIYLEHILESIGLIEGYKEGKTEEDLYSSIPLQDMIMRRLEIIGEAVKNLPDEIRENHPDIPWKKIAGLRDELIHHYFGIDIELIWNIVENDLPQLKKRIKEIKDTLER